MLVDNLKLKIIAPKVRASNVNMFSVDDLDQPDLEHEQIEDNSNEEEAQEEKKDGDTTAVVKKARKSSTRPKLDLERLKGPRGLPVIEKLFSKTKFKGHGHEQEDLKTVMRTLHYWCHRLFPKWTFDDTLAHLERMGTKKPVMTLKKKILFDMLQDEPLIRMDLDEDPPEDVEDPIVPMNDFDMLLQTDLPSTSRATSSAVPSSSTPPGLSKDQKDMIAKNRLLAAERRKARLEAQKLKELEKSLSTPQDITSSLDITGALTDEQKMQMEQNRLLAMERRMNRMNQEQPQESIVHNLQNSTQEPIMLEEDSRDFAQGSEDLVQVSQETMPDSEELVNNAQDSMPDSEDLVQLAQESIADSEDLVQLAQESMPDSEDLQVPQDSEDLIKDSVPDSADLVEGSRELNDSV